MMLFHYEVIHKNLEGTYNLILQIPIVWCMISGTMTCLNGSARTVIILISAIAIDLIYRTTPTIRWLVNSNAKSIAE